MSISILEGNKIYSNGRMSGILNLEEGQKAGPFIIIENSCSPLKVIDPTPSEMEETIVLENGNRGKPLLTLEGRFQMADTINANNRIYPDSVWERSFSNKDLMSSIDNGEMLGEADHPKDGETRLSRVCGKVTKLWRNPNDNKEILGRFIIFNNEAGKNLKAIHEGGGRLGVSSRGQGSVARLDGKDVVQEDYQLKTWDVVHGPSTPGAYPEEVSESKKEKPQETKMSNKRLEELSSRFKKICSKVVKNMSTDAVVLLKESADEIQNCLITESFGDSSPAAAKLVTEVTNFLRDISEKTESGDSPSVHYDKEGETPWGKEPKKDDHPDQEESEEEEDVSENSDKAWASNWMGKKYPDNAKLKDAFVKGYDSGNFEKNPYSRGTPLGISYSAGALAKKKTDENGSSNSLPRGNSKEVVESMALLFGIEPSTNIQEMLTAVRSAYRSSVNIEGPLHKHEIDGIQEAVKHLVAKAEVLLQECPVIRAIITTSFDDPVGEVVEASSEADLRRKVRRICEKKTGPVFVSIDRSELVYSDCSKKFSGLLESQVLKTDSVVRGKADLGAKISELSAKISGGKRLIEAFAVRCKKLELEKADLVANFEAACRILDEMPKEMKLESIKGVVAATAALNTSRNDIPEMFSGVSSLKEAISVAKGLDEKLESYTIEREPVFDKTLDKIITEEKRVKIKGKKNSPSDSNGGGSLLEKVMSRIQAKGGK